MTVPYLLCRVSCRLLEEVYEVGRAEFAQCDEIFGACINCLMEGILGDPRSRKSDCCQQRGLGYLDILRNRWSNHCGYLQSNVGEVLVENTPGATESFKVSLGRLGLQRRDLYFAGLTVSKPLFFG